MSDLQVDILLKHYKNVYDLSRKQFAALKEDSLADITGFIEQKQIIFEHIKCLNSETIREKISDEMTQRMRQILADIIELEDKSQGIVSQSQGELREKLLVFRQTENLRQIYEAPLASGAIVNQVK